MHETGKKNPTAHFRDKLLKRKVVNSVALLILFAFLLSETVVSIPWWCYVLVFFGWFLITVFGSFFVGWNYHLKSLHSNTEIAENWISISFDDGPNPTHTPKVLKLLKQYGAKATFFVIGQQAAKHPDIVRRILEEGHSIGNHTYFHSKTFGFFGTQRVKDELAQTRSTIQKFTGLKMNLYRPVFGVTNPQIEKAVRGLGLHSIGWSVRSLDTTPRSQKTILKRITTKVSAGDIILLHDTSEKSVVVLERLLIFFQEKKMKSVTVEQLLEIEAYA